MPDDMPETVPDTRPDNLVVVGQGYVGLPLAVRAVEQGYSVVGFDVDGHKAKRLASGDSPVEDIPDGRLQAALDTGRYLPTSDPADLAGFDAAVISVPTPLTEGAPDLSFIEDAARTLAGHLTRGACVVLESTTYPGTTEELLLPILEQGSGLTAGTDFHLGYSPERIDPGNPVFTFENTPKVVSGIDPTSLAAVQELYDRLVERTVPVSSPREAELTKLLENTFRALNLAFANEMAGVAKHYGLDIIELMDAAATKPYGFLVHYPGAGIGGHCIPVDPYYLLAPLADTGVATPIATTAMRRVAERPADVASRALEVLSERGLAPEDARVLVVGMAYKPGVQDYRESPACAITQHLAATGVRVDYYDPLVESAEIPGAGALSSVAGPVAADYDLALVATVHPGFDYGFLADCAAVLDATYRTPGGRQRHTV
ncbi:MAG: nucleotide sugar dehydrogenase [Acidimicrobiales bacterium]